MEVGEMEGLKRRRIRAGAAGIAAFLGIFLVGASGFAQEEEKPVFGENGFTAEEVGEGNREVRFTCTATDPDGEVVNYTIDYGDANRESSPDGIFQHIYADAGDYWAFCTATDDAGMERTAGPNTIKIMPASPGGTENAAPAITSFEAQWENRELQQARFTCIAEDTDGEVVGYALDPGDGSDAIHNDSGVFSHTYSGTGTFPAYCTAADDEGATSAAGPIDVTITGPDAPEAGENISPTITAFEAGWENEELRQARFTCTAEDPDGQVVSYTLDPGQSGGRQSNATGIFHHTYSGPGTFSAYCTATDNDSGTRTTGPLNVTISSSPSSGDDGIDDDGGDDGDTNNCFIRSAGNDLRQCR